LREEEILEQMFISAIIVGAGSATRMDGQNKITMRLPNGQMVIESCLEPFINSKLVNEIVIVATKALVSDFKDRFKGERIKVVAGGKDRAASVFSGVLATSPQADFLCIHDAARPFLSEQLLKSCIVTAVKFGACVPVLSSEDTLKIVNDQSIESTVDRGKIFRVQTPQIFRKSDYIRAMAVSKGQETVITDDSQLLEMGGIKAHTVPGEKTNIKITTREDFDRIKNKSRLKIGHGYDVHRLVAGRRLILGGVDINFHLGLEGHSDADVLTHAIMDSLLGAAGLKDIGCIFPANDERYKNAISIKLLSSVKKKLEHYGATIVNIDATIVAQAPELKGYIYEMRQNIAKSLCCELQQINVKATTEEGLGFTGTGDGVAAYSVCLLEG
jgi:2-C-methyl-D-erythritol 2,4-cyclodiphosphate synthase/2-C-methyl-D-erythritol 4-phosphate cytidylyltransferase